MSLLSSDTFKKFGSTNQSYEEFIKDLAGKYQASDKLTIVEHDTNLQELTEEFIHERKYKAGCLTQFVILLGRAVKNAARLFTDEIMRLITMIVLGLFMISLFYEVIITFIVVGI